MARISKNGNLSGAVGNLVFVQNGKEQYVRSKPHKVKQSAETKKAASVFGWVSSRDKEYRRVVVEKFSLLTDSRYAARHRARMAKTLGTPNPVLPATGELSFQNPEALVGFDFNTHLLWEKATQFYPEYTLDELGNVKVKIPALHWGKQIKSPKKCKTAHLKLEAFSLDPNAEPLEITAISSVNFLISPTQSQEATSWDFVLPTNKPWIVVLGILSFDLGRSHFSEAETTSTTYLWAKNSANF